MYNYLLSNNGDVPWICEIKKILEESGKPDIFDEVIENTDQIYSEIKEILYKQYWDRWQSQTVDIRVCPILRTYRLFKTEIKLEPYLLEVKDSVTIRFLSRFWLSSHNLYIETGRWQCPKIPPEDRICPSCKNGVEDEIHVFVQCQRYNDLRVLFFHKLSMLLNDFENQCDNQKFILAMLSTDPEVIKMVGKFVNAIFSLRECI